MPRSATRQNKTTSGALCYRPASWAGSTIWRRPRPARAKTITPPDVKHRLIYVLNVETAPTGGAARATISPVTATLLKAGGFGASPKFYNPNNIYNYQPAKYLRPLNLRSCVNSP